MNTSLTLDTLERRQESREDASVADYLLLRSLGRVGPAVARQTARKQYVNIVPSATLYEQEMPACLRRFSPCGKVFCFGKGPKTHSIWLDLGGATTLS